MATGKEIWKIVEEFNRKRKVEGADGLPWPGYSGGKQFCCDRCGTRFDTSVGKAWHEVNDCAEAPRPPARTTPLPSCPKCHSYALYQDGSGTVTCGTCGARQEAR